MAKTLIVLGKIWLWLAGALILLGCAVSGGSKVSERFRDYTSLKHSERNRRSAHTGSGFGLLKLGEHMRQRQA